MNKRPGYSPEVQERAAYLVLTNDSQARFNYTRCPFVLIAVLMGKKLKNQFDERGRPYMFWFYSRQKKAPPTRAGLAHGCPTISKRGLSEPLSAIWQ